MNPVVPGDGELGSGQDEAPPEATVLRMLLGAQLRRLRETAGISAEKAGFEIRASRSKISRMETGRVGLKVRDVEDLLTLYGVTSAPQRAKVIALARRSRAPEWWAKYNDILPDWFETYLGLESAATSIRSFEMQFVPGLFQTEDYARAVTTLGHQAARVDEIERRVSLRLKRQELLARAQPPRMDLGGDGRGGAAQARGRASGDAGTAPPPGRGGAHAGGDLAGRPVRPRRSRRRERVVLDPALRGA
jgi:transcriptional regulator with XRE-family HTH domain